MSKHRRLKQKENEQESAPLRKSESQHSPHSDVPRRAPTGLRHRIREAGNAAIVASTVGSLLGRLLKPKKKS